MRHEAIVQGWACANGRAKLHPNRRAGGEFPAGGAPHVHRIWIGSIPGYPGLATVAAPPNATVSIPPPTPDERDPDATLMTCKGGAAKFSAWRLKPGATVGLGAHAVKA